jgi:hypothetical protein
MMPVSFLYDWRELFMSMNVNGNAQGVHLNHARVPEKMAVASSLQIVRLVKQGSLKFAREVDNHFDSRGCLVRPASLADELKANAK